MDANITREEFLQSYSECIDQGSASLFVGAGLSKAAKVPLWKDLLKPLAADIGIDIEQELDLVAVAQYITLFHNSRQPITDHMRAELGRSTGPTEVHKLLVQLPIPSLWTTNYDQLIEQAFASGRRIVDVKVVRSDFAQDRPQRDAVLYKMHGDQDRLEDTILLKEDYESFWVNRQEFANHLRAELVSKSFLFLGFSFADPNFERFLAEIRVLMAGTGRSHFWIDRRVSLPLPPPSTATAEELRLHEKKVQAAKYAQLKQGLRIADLRRYGIRTLLLEGWEQLPQLLRDLLWHTRRRHVFVSGSAAYYLALPQERIEDLARQLGNRLVSQSYHLLSALGTGIGGHVAIGAMESLYDGSHARVEDFVTLRPFRGMTPQGMTKGELEEHVRRSLLQRAGFAVFLAGNKRDAAGNVVPADGVKREFELARELGVLPIPVGATGDVAREIWDTVSTNFASFFPAAPHSAALRSHFDTLNDSSADVTKLLDAIFGMLQILSH